MPHRPATLRGLSALGLVLALAACSALGGGGKRMSAEEVAAVILEARDDLDAGRTEQALEGLRRAREAEGLPLELRTELETLLEQIADRRIRELEAQPGGEGELEDMLDLNLPGPIAVTAGVTAARKRLAAGKPYKAFRMLQKLEQRYPTHHERRAAGEICAEAGLKMSSDKKRFLGFFSDRGEGIEALEWLVVTYPSEPRGDEAYFRLAEIYAADRDFDLSVRRYEDLVAYHLKSPLAIDAEARIPRMRLAGLESPEYDRRELLRARLELEAWLERHAGHELEQRVRLDYGDCLRRLVLSDQGIARFYLRIEQAFGARLHADRALQTARVTGDPALVSGCEALLAQVTKLEQELAGGRQPERFLDRPDAELRPAEALQTPPEREGGGGGS